jgi:hypothetical protein
MSLDNRVNEDGFDFDEAANQSIGVFTKEEIERNEKMRQLSLQFDLEGEYPWEYS